MWTISELWTNPLQPTQIKQCPVSGSSALDITITILNKKIHETLTVFGLKSYHGMKGEFCEIHKVHALPYKII